MARGGPLPAAGIMYDFSNVSYEYQVTILPSGKVYKITNINYGDE